MQVGAVSDFLFLTLSPKYELPKEEDGNPNKKPRTPIVCHKCGSMGHKAATCNLQPRDPAREARPQYPLRPLESVQCYKCKQMGHYANACTIRTVF